MKGVIWATSQEKANYMLDIIKENYERSGINPIKEKGYRLSEILGSWLELENGDIWQAVVAHESGRGIKCNVSYIDRNIPQNIIDCIIMPSTSASPYQATHYFNLDWMNRK